MEPATHHNSTTTHPTAPTIWSKGSKGGLITGAVLVIFSLLMYLLGEANNAWLSGLTTLFSLIIGIALTHRAFKEENEGFMTYGQGLGLGSVLGLIAGLLVGIFSFIYVSFVDPNVMQERLDETRYQYEEMGMADSQIDQSMAMMEMIFTPGMTFIFSIIGLLFYAFVLSLIISAFTKNNHPEHVY
ncbi:hypothetical protein D770_21480 [Flammeovirgaceae bacterium 311]|nr:hypothetical protein D770_21480 [Flammeovirgaceae bacterium 311]